MKTTGNLLYAQSGGPTAVINSSVLGALETAKQYPEIKHVYAAYHGVEGIIDETIFNLGTEDKQETSKLLKTPGAALGSCRYKLQSKSDLAKVLAVFQKYDIRYFLYNGGNDSMDTCSKLATYFAQVNYDCKVIGVPKTIDNDLVATDHCPGFASAARFISTMLAEVTYDAQSYTSEQIIVFEIMGRNAGWLAASASLARLTGYGPDFIYLPEVTFDLDKFISDIQALRSKKKLLVIAVAESLRLKDGRFVTDLVGQSTSDVFGHQQMGGAGQVLASILKERLQTKVRAIEFSLLQRAASHLASEVDTYEAYQVAAYAVKQAVKGVSGKMVTILRAAASHKLSQDFGQQLDEGVKEKLSQAAQAYKSSYGLVDLAKVANQEKLVPRAWINEAGNDVTTEFVNYCLPLVSNLLDFDMQATLKVADNGLPNFSDLKRTLVSL